MHAGRYWDPETKKHTDGDGPGERAFSALPFDCDGDGDLDLIIGTKRGGLYVRENKGSKDQPAFSEELEKLPVRVPNGYAMPVAADWDGDGRIDLISGSEDGAVYWFRNSSKKKLKLRKPVELVGKADQRQSKSKKRKKRRSKRSKQSAPPVPRGTRSQVAVFDYDGDGDMDLLVGDYSAKMVGDKRERHGWVWLYRRAGKSKSRIAQK